MIVDTSAIMAILSDEPDAAHFGMALSRSERVTMSAATLVELAQVAEGRGGRAMGDELDALLFRSGIEVVAFTPEQARIAREGWRRFGKGRGHPAQLNLGDCFAYALAQERGEPLLFKGNDFARTDVTPAP